MIAQNMMYPPPPYFMVGIRFWCWCAEPFFLPHIMWCVLTNNSTLVSSVHRTSIKFLQTSNLQQCFFLDCSSFFCGVFPWTPLLFYDFVIVDLSTEIEEGARHFYKFLADTLGFFFTTPSSLPCSLAVNFTDNHPRETSSRAELSPFIDSLS